MIEGGTIAKVGEAAALLPTLAPGTPVDHYPDQLVLPGLIDTHLHFPQTQVIASYGAQLLEWLQKYTFVEEQKFAEPDHARRVAGFFMDELLRNGTTTAVVYCSVHAESAEAFFAESHKRNTRMIAGKVMMDRGAPPGLLDTAQRGYDESKALIGRWHGQRRQLYAISPRFALTSTEAQLEASGALVREHPDCYVQTHLAENHDEIATARRLYPAAASYTDIYDRYGLLGPRSLFGHCIHLDEPELERLSATRSIAAFCPTSNLFIGSGLFDLAMMRDPRRPVRVSLATDVGGGTSYSMLRTAAEAYKVLQLRRQNLPAFDAFYLMTLGNARALSLEDRIGSLESGQGGRPSGPRRSRHACHGASHGDDLRRSGRGAVRADDHGRRPLGTGDLRRREEAARGVATARDCASHTARAAAAAHRVPCCGGRVLPPRRNGGPPVGSRR